MTEPADERKSNSDVARDRAAFRDLWPGVIALILIQGSLVALDPDGDANGWVVVWSLLPVIPALWLVRAQMRSLQRADEYQRVIQLEAMAIGFATVIILAMIGGLLDAAGIGDATQSLQITFIVGLLSWVTALGIKTQRSR